MNKEERMQNINIEQLKSAVQVYIEKNFIEECKQKFSYIMNSIQIINECSENLHSEVFYQKISIDTLDEMEPTFSQMLFKFIREKGVSETMCYKHANLDRRLFSKIRSNKDYQPRKNTIFALIIGLKLNLGEAEKLLDSAGYSISHSIKLDVIMEYLIKKQVYDILVVNEILDSFDCPLLGQTC